MSLGQITDLVIVVLSVVVTIIFYFYSKHKIEIDKKALQGDALAKAEQMIARSAGAIVFQTDKEGGSGQEKRGKLSKFLSKQNKKTLSVNQRALLIEQKQAMGKYAKVLKLRIEDLKEAK